MINELRLACSPCQNICNKRRCRLYANRQLEGLRPPCGCAPEIESHTKFMKFIDTLVRAVVYVMVICGIPRYKALQSEPVTTYALLNYYRKCDCPLSRRLMEMYKTNVCYDLGKKCQMNMVEVHLAYAIIKVAFQAFHYRSQQEILNETEPKIETEECVYVMAAKKTAETYKRFFGLSKDEEIDLLANLYKPYKWFYKRMQKIFNEPEKDNCNCCFCVERRGYIYTEATGKEPVCKECRRKLMRREKRKLQLIPSHSFTPISSYETLPLAAMEFSEYREPLTDAKVDRYEEFEPEISMLNQTLSEMDSMDSNDLN